MSICRRVMWRASRACSANVRTLRNDGTGYSESGMPRSWISLMKPPQRRRQANSRSNRLRSSSRASVMNWFSVPPHIRVGTTFRIRALCTGELRSPGVLQRHGKPRDGKEVELVGNRVKERRDAEGGERYLDAGRQVHQVLPRGIARRVPLDRPGALEAAHVEPEEEQQSRHAEVHAVLEIRVVDAA